MVHHFYHLSSLGKRRGKFLTLFCWLSLARFCQKISSAVTPIRVTSRFINNFLSRPPRRGLADLVVVYTK